MFLWYENSQYIKFHNPFTWLPEGNDYIFSAFCMYPLYKPPPSHWERNPLLSKQSGAFACQLCLDNRNIKDNCTQTVVSLSYIVLFDVCIW